MGKRGLQNCARGRGSVSVVDCAASERRVARALAPLSSVGAIQAKLARSVFATDAAVDLWDPNPAKLRGHPPPVKDGGRIRRAHGAGEWLGSAAELHTALLFAARRSPLAARRSARRRRRVGGSRGSEIRAARPLSAFFREPAPGGGGRGRPRPRARTAPPPHLAAGPFRRGPELPGPRSTDPSTGGVFHPLTTPPAAIAAAPRAARPSGTRTHPQVKWAQRADSLYVTIALPDVKDEKVRRARVRCGAGWAIGAIAAIAAAVASSSSSSSSSRPPLLFLLVLLVVGLAATANNYCRRNAITPPSATIAVSRPPPPPSCHRAAPPNATPSATLRHHPTPSNALLPPSSARLAD